MLFRGRGLEEAAWDRSCPNCGGDDGDEGLPLECAYCHGWAHHGKVAPVDSEYAGRWFCVNCWCKWEGAHGHGGRPMSPFSGSFQSPLRCPSRLECLPKELVDDATSIHYAMVNDTDRNDFYWEAMQVCDVSGRRVLDIGTGSGLLAMMAARLGAEHVVAVEESGDLARLARANIAANGLEGIVEVQHGMSTATELALSKRCDVLITETLGTWMTCEGMVQWCEDARDRLLTPGAVVIPTLGTQYAVLIESEELAALTSCWRPYRGIDISMMMELQDTASCLWSKKYGIRLSDIVYREVCEPFPVLEVEFGVTRLASLPSVSSHGVVVVGGDARVHAVLTFWEVYGPGTRVLSTNPGKRCGKAWSYAREVNWGNAFQLVDAAEDAEDADVGKEGAWRRYDGVDVPQDEDVFALSAEDLPLVKCACIHHGYWGFSVVGGVAHARTQRRECLADPANHVPTRGSVLHVAAFHVGGEGLDRGGPPRLPKPLDVVAGEKLVVTVVHDTTRSRGQFGVGRSLGKGGGAAGRPKQLGQPCLRGTRIIGV